MKRRSALAGMLAMLAGCGGGGDAPTAAAPAPSAPPAQALAGVATWGDSLTDDYAPVLQTLMPERTVFNGGGDGQISSEIAARFMADTAGRRGWPTVFWYGRNNVTHKDQVLADLAACVAGLSPGAPFLVLSVLNTTNEPKGSVNYAAVIALNDALAATYPSQFLDIRAFLVAQFDPANAQDVIDHGRDELPTSLRRDIVHLNAAGNMLVATRLKQQIEAAGW